MTDKKYWHGVYSWLNEKAYVRKFKKIDEKNHELVFDHYIPLPIKLEKMLDKIAGKFDIEVVEFTSSFEEESGLTVIAAVAPPDQFSKKTGIKIVKDRMKWALNQLENGKTIDHKSWVIQS